MITANEFLCNADRNSICDDFSLITLLMRGGMQKMSMNIFVLNRFKMSNLKVQTPLNDPWSYHHNFEDRDVKIRNRSWNMGII